MQYPAHGANPASLYKALQLDMPTSIIDVSENVNVFGTPEEVVQQWGDCVQLLQQYPHEEAEPFTSAAAAYHGILREHVAVSNGAAESLNVIAQSFAGKRVVLLEPSFSEYRRTLMQYGCTIEQVVATSIEQYTFDEDVLRDALNDAAACYICNPNNPTGVLTARASIERYVASYPQCTFVIDEAFMDWTDEVESCVSLVSHYNNIIVLRSMTKMYGLAGVRLGYMLTQKAQQYRAYFPHWNVSTVAIALGVTCFQQHAFVEKSRAHADKLRTTMSEQLRAIGARVTNSRANFLTFSLPNVDADAFFMHMLKRGIVLRHTKNYVGLNGRWFRIAVKSDDIWATCLQEMTDYVQHDSSISPR